MHYIKQLEWRYATKRMNGQKIPAQKLDNILKAVQLAPTSLGLQPLKILVVESEEGKNKIAKACQQPQVRESSAMLVFCHWNDVSETQIDAYMQNIAEVRNQEVAALGGFKKMVTDFTQNMDNVTTQNWASRQAYIALGFGLVAAALEHVDATPMEGFSPVLLDEALNLSEKGLKSVVLMALGYRDEEKDYLAKAPKVRRAAEDFFERM